MRAHSSHTSNDGDDDDDEKSEQASWQTGEVRARARARVRTMWLCMFFIRWLVVSVSLSLSHARCCDLIKRLLSNKQPFPPSMMDVRTFFGILSVVIVERTSEPLWALQHRLCVVIFPIYNISSRFFILYSRVVVLFTFSFNLPAPCRTPHFDTHTRIHRKN